MVQELLSEGKILADKAGYILAAVLPSADGAGFCQELFNFGNGREMAEHLKQAVPHVSRLEISVGASAGVSGIVFCTRCGANFVGDFRTISASPGGLTKLFE